MSQAQVSTAKKLEALHFLRDQVDKVDKVNAQQMENAASRVGSFMGFVVHQENFRKFSIMNNTEVVWEPWTAESFTAFIDANISALDQPAIRPALRR